MTLRMADIYGRLALPEYLNKVGLTGEAVEIGTHQGAFAIPFLKNWHGDLLHCVDTWESGYNDLDPVSHGNRIADFNFFLDNLRSIPSHSLARCTIHKKDSLVVAKEFAHEKHPPLDFVYVDGNHDYSSVVTDITFWWPLLKKGGVMAGHDFLCPGEHKGGWGEHVQQAVFDFVRDYPQDIWLIQEFSGPWSFLLRKGCNELY